MTKLSADSSRTARLLRVPVSELRAGLMKLDKGATHYLLHVHRAVVGDEFLAFDVESATEALAMLVVADSRHALYAVERVQISSHLPKYPLVLIQAFGKGAKVDQVVRDATVLDASELWIVSTSRSAISSPREVQGRMQRWRKIAIEAARQSERGNIPRIVGVLAFSEALKSLEQFLGGKWLLSPWAAQTLGEKLVGLATNAAALLVGPEGGFDDNELCLAREAGFAEVRMGFRVLRSETAALAALGAIAAFRDQSLDVVPPNLSS